METKEIKELWNKYNTRLEQNWSLNLKLVKEMNLQKTRSSMNFFLFLKSLSLLLLFLVAHFLINFIIDNHQNTTLTVPAYILSMVTYIAIIWSFYHIGSILLINYAEPVVEIQKKIEKLKIQKLRYNKFVFYCSYPFVYLMGFTVLRLDITHFPLAWMTPNIILAILWIPFCNWLIRKYNSDNLSSRFWKTLSRDSTLTPGSVSKSLNNSLNFLQEIRDFEGSKG